jgi:gliding motility-associated lipoprotein GldH
MKINRFEFFGLVFFIFIFGVLGCTSEKVYEPLPVQNLSGGWSYSDSLVFNGVNSKDRRSNQSLKLRITISDTFEFENIYLRGNFVGTKDASGSKVFSVQLADKFGSWLGSCGGSICTIDYDLEEEQIDSFTDDGMKISISQWTRDSILYGVSDLQIVWSEKN